MEGKFFSQFVRRAIPLLSALGVLSCSETVGPSSRPGFSSDVAGSTGSSGIGVTLPTTIRFTPGAPPLETYDTSFVFTVGMEGTRSVHFANDTTKFLKLYVPKDAQFFDSAGTPLRKWDKVQVSLHIDSLSAAVQFGPHGSAFLGHHGPALLYLSYAFLDLGGQSPGDASVWYQPDAGSAWSPLATQVDVTRRWLIAPIYHFSNYAVAY